MDEDTAGDRNSQTSQFGKGNVDDEESPTSNATSLSTGASANVKIIETQEKYLQQEGYEGTKGITTGSGTCSCGGDGGYVLQGQRLLSLFFVFTFFASTITQFNDASGVETWILYYSLQSIMSFFFLLILLHCPCLRTFHRQNETTTSGDDSQSISSNNITSIFNRMSLRTKTIFGSILLLLIWSLVLVLIGFARLGNADDDEANEKGRDIPNYSTEKEEIAFEMAGAVLGLFCSVYHMWIFYQYIR